MNEASKGGTVLKKYLSFILCLVIWITMMNLQIVEAATKINKSKAIMEVDSTLKLKVTGTNNKITWKSSKRSVATVNGSGLVTAKYEGKAKITATVGKKTFMA